jgi:hypothetical protein
MVDGVSLGHIDTVERLLQEKAEVNAARYVNLQNVSYSCNRSP